DPISPPATPVSAATERSEAASPPPAKPAGSGQPSGQSAQPERGKQAPEPSTSLKDDAKPTPAVEAGEKETSAAPHFRDAASVKTPAGAIAASSRGNSPSSIWYRQGDPSFIALDASVRVEGKEPSDAAKALAQKVRKANEQGYRFRNYRAGSAGTVWVLEKDGKILTRAGLDAILDSPTRPDVQPTKGGEFFDKQMNAY